VKRLARLSWCAAIATVIALQFMPGVTVASPSDVVRDCSEDGKLDGHYTQGELQGALKKLPSDIDEYTDCRSVIRDASRSKAAGGRGGSGARAAVAGSVNGSVPPSPQEQRELDEAGESAVGVDIGGEKLTPGQAGFAAAAFDNDLPALLIAVFVLFGAAALVAVVFALHRLWPAAVGAIGNGLLAPARAIGSRLRDGAGRIRR
jgi:hypothetical protein